jgi:hypothetical protein
MFLSLNELSPVFPLVAKPFQSKSIAVAVTYVLPTYSIYLLSFNTFPSR